MAWFATRNRQYVALAKAVSPYVVEDGLILDVGANIGYFTKVVCDELGFMGRVELFEPLPHLAELCRKTISELPCKCVVHEFGLGGADAQLRIHVASEGNLGWNTVVAERATSDMIPVDIEVRRFDELPIDGVPCLVKIDVEGAESQVLEGMMASFESWSPKPAVLCEVGWGQDHPHWDTELAVFERLTDLGYTAHSLDGAALDLASLKKTTDVLFLPHHLRA